MRKIVTLAASAAFTVAMMVPMFAAEQTVKGEVVDDVKLLDFVAKQVVVVGDVTEKDGKKMIAVKSIKLAN
ncbi:MAG: hypothetical protein LC791_17415 [Acidobacteria bacterium]|nr:hypothetical protein [Acidobacteriota bacterium]